MTLDQVIKGIEDVAVKSATEFVMKGLVNLSGFFALTFVNVLVGKFVGMILVILAGDGEFAAFRMFSRFITGKQAQSLRDAFEKHLDAQARGSHEDRRRAEQELIDRARDLIRFNR